MYIFENVILSSPDRTNLLSTREGVYKRLQLQKKVALAVPLQAFP